MAKKIAAALLLLVLIAGVCTGCEKGYADVWQCAYMDTGDQVMTAYDLKSAGTDLTIDLRTGGLGYMTADGETQKIGWTESADGASLQLNVDGEMETFTIDHDGLVWEIDGVSVTFLREKSEGYEKALSSSALDEWTGE